MNEEQAQGTEPVETEVMDTEIDGTQQQAGETEEQFLARHQSMKEDASVLRVLEKAYKRLRYEENDPIPAVFTLIGLIVAVYLFAEAPGNDWVYEQGMFYTPALNQGEWWRLLTPNLLHGGIWHLLMNGFGLYIFGRGVEAVMGPRNMGILVLWTALTTSAISYGWEMWPYWSGVLDYDLIDFRKVTPFRPALGASGISYGLMGAMFTLHLLILKQVNPLRFGERLRGVALLMLLYVGYDYFRGGIDISGHLGGFSGGCAFATAYTFAMMAKARKNWMGWGIDTRL